MNAPPLPHLSLDDLHAAHDGPLPDGVERVIRLGGSARCRLLRRQADERLHARLASEARLGLARHRPHLSAAHVLTDPWLSRLAATLASHRRGAVGALEGFARNAHIV